MTRATPDPRWYGWDRAAHERRQARLGLELTPAERLRWLEETMDELRQLVGRARRPRSARRGDPPAETTRTGGDA
ncbi:MAG: hypothetical protein ACC742_10865 [Thermoanaerobaculales bacterium]